MADAGCLPFGGVSRGFGDGVSVKVLILVSIISVALGVFIAATCKKKVTLD